MVHIYFYPLTHQQARRQDAEDGDDEESDLDNMSDEDYVSDADEIVDCCYVCYEVRWHINCQFVNIDY
jgi:hypothetical protein